MTFAGSGPGTAMNDLLSAFLGDQTSNVAPITLGVVATYETSFVDAVTSNRILAAVNANNDIVEYFYLTETGDKIVTTTGFTAGGSATAPQSESVYETKADGVVERLTKWTPFDALNSPLDPFYRQPSAPTVDYVPDAASIVAVAPQQVRMGLETFSITAAPAGLPNIPTLANADGQEFPQHALIHVEVGTETTAAGIAFVTDGSDPSISATAVQLEVSAGTSITLDNNVGINGFSAVPLDVLGNVDPTLVAKLSVEYSNIDSDKDDI